MSITNLSSNRIGVITMSTVSAVNGVYQYTQSYQSQFFGSAVSTDRLNQLMKEYGIQQTGDQHKDIENLYEAMYGYYSQQSQGVQQFNQQDNQTQSTQNATSVPWASVMEEVGLTPTGDLEKDYATFNAKIQELEGSVQSDEDKSKIDAFATEAQSVFTQTNNNTQPTDTRTSAQNAISGAELLAKLNQAFFVG